MFKKIESAQYCKNIKFHQKKQFWDNNHENTKLLEGENLSQKVYPQGNTLHDITFMKMM